MKILLNFLVCLLVAWKDLSSVQAIDHFCLEYFDQSEDWTSCTINSIENDCYTSSLRHKTGTYLTTLKTENGQPCLVSSEDAQSLQCTTIDEYCGGDGYHNVALNKPASQSSVYDQNRLPSVGNDGSSCIDSTSCTTHTEDELNPWWEVDLEGTFKIESFKLYNRGESNAFIYRIRYFEIEFLDLSRTVVHTVRYSQWGEVYDIFEDVFPSAVIANYIRISLPSGVLNFREFEAFGVTSENNNICNEKFEEYEQLSMCNRQDKGMCYKAKQGITTSVLSYENNRICNIDLSDVSTKCHETFLLINEPCDLSGTVVVSPQTGYISFSSTNGIDQDTRGWLDSNTGWASGNANKDNAWYQIHLNSTRNIVGVVTQGKAVHFNEHQYVSFYKVQYSVDNVNFYDVDNGYIFAANTVLSDTKVTNLFNTPVSAQYIRIWAESYVGHPFMRAGVVIGCIDKVGCAESFKGYCDSTAYELNCASCDAISGYFVENAACTACDSEHYSDGSGCIACTGQNNCLITDTTSCMENGSKELKCSSCKEGFFDDAQGLCSGCTKQLNCNVTFNECRDYSFLLKCETCDPDSYLEDDLCKMCTDQALCAFSSVNCLDNNDKERYCNGCFPGSKSVNGRCGECTEQIGCESSFTDCLDSSFELSCQTCKPGFNLANGTCTACLAQNECSFTDNSMCVPSTGLLACNDCKEGFRPDSTGKCIECSQSLGCNNPGTDCLAAPSFRLSCLACEPNYYLNDGSCLECQAQSNCAESNDSKCMDDSTLLQCLKCSPDHFLNTTTKACEQCVPDPNCLDGSSTLCADANIVADATLLQCYECNSSIAAPLFLLNNQCSYCELPPACKLVDAAQCRASSQEVDCLECFSNYYNQNGDCIECTSQDRCTKSNSNCLPGGTKLKCEECVPSFFVEDDLCKECNPAPNCTKKGNICLPGSEFLACDTCDPGFFLKNGQCHSCKPQPNCQSSNTELCYSSETQYFACNTCEQGFYLNNGLCEACTESPNCLDSDNSTCAIDSNMLKCNACDTTITHLDITTGLCIDCRPDSKNCKRSGDVCVRNSEFLYCDECVEDSFLSQGICTKCTGNQNNCELNGVSCLDIDKKRCEKCSDLYFVKEGKCELQVCRGDTVAPEEYTLRSCARFHETQCVANTAESYCVECAPGAYSLNNDGICEKCRSTQTCKIANETNCNAFNLTYCLEPSNGNFLAASGVAFECVQATSCLIFNATRPCVDDRFFFCEECDSGFVLSEGRCTMITDSAFETKYIVIIAVGFVLLVALVIITFYVYKKKMSKKIENIENKGLNGMTPQAFIMNEFEKDGAPSVDMMTDQEYLDSRHSNDKLVQPEGQGPEVELSSDYYVHMENLGQGHPGENGPEEVDSTNAMIECVDYGGYWEGNQETAIDDGYSVPKEVDTERAATESSVDNEYWEQ